MYQTLQDKEIIDEFITSEELNITAVNNKKLLVEYTLNTTLHKENITEKYDHANGLQVNIWTFVDKVIRPKNIKKLQHKNYNFFRK